MYTLTLAGTSHFAILHGTGGGVGTTPPRVWPLIELELRRKNERVRLHERKSMVPNFKLVASEVRANTRRGPPEMTIFWRP